MRVLIIAHPTVAIDVEKRRIVDRIAKRITDAKGVADVTYTLKAGYGKKYSSYSIYEGYDAVFAAGGDETVNDVATGLVGTSLPLGIIPLGEHNNLAEGLGIPLTPEGFTPVLFGGQRITIDAGKAAGRHFFSVAGIGQDTPGDDRSRGLLGCLFSALKHHLFSRAEHLTMTVDGREIKRSVYALTVSNIPYSVGDAHYATQADPRSGKLVVVLELRTGLMAALGAARQYARGETNIPVETETFDFKSLKIHREKAGEFYADGEVHQGADRLNVHVIPAAVTILVPGGTPAR